MTTYSGVCAGGPYHGQEMVKEHFVVHIPFEPVLSACGKWMHGIMEAPAGDRVKVGWYTWDQERHPNGRTFWRWHPPAN